MKRLIVLLASIATLALGIGMTARPAFASNPYGLCMTNYTSQCARANWNSSENSYDVDRWGQDISGDSLQQWTRHYLGSVTDSGGGCWPFTCGNGFNSEYVGNSVWYFTDNGVTSGDNCMSSDDLFDEYLADCYNNTVDMYVWTSSGLLIDVAETDAEDTSYCLSDEGEYYPLVVNPRPYCDTWTWREGS